MAGKAFIQAATLAGGVLAATAAGATTRSFVYSDTGSPVASGYFSYPTGETGVLHYGDLTDFSITVAGVTYTLADVLLLTDYVWFAYDTAANAFNVAPDSCGFDGCGFYPSLSAIDSAGASGFFFTSAAAKQGLEYSTATYVSFDAIAIAPSVPEPGTWALLSAGFAGLGFLGYTRGRKPRLA